MFLKSEASFSTQRIQHCFALHQRLADDMQYITSFSSEKTALTPSVNSDPWIICFLVLNQVILKPKPCLLEQTWLCRWCCGENLPQPIVYHVFSCHETSAPLLLGVMMVKYAFGRLTRTHCRSVFDFMAHLKMALFRNLISLLCLSYQMTPRCLLVGHTAPVLCLARASVVSDNNYIVSSSESGWVCGCNNLSN